MLFHVPTEGIEPESPPEYGGGPESPAIFRFLVKPTFIPSEA